MAEPYEVPEMYDRDRPLFDSITLADRLIWAHQHPPPEDYECESGPPDWDEIYRDGKLRIGDEEFQVARIIPRNNLRDNLGIKPGESDPVRMLSLAMWIVFVVAVLVAGTMLL